MSSPMSGSALTFALLVAAFFTLQPPSTSAGHITTHPQNVREFHKGIAMLNAVVNFPDPPPPSTTIDAKLDYCELVLAELEAQLPRKSLFRWLFLDRTRLASGYEKEFRFSYDSYPYLNHYY